MRGESFFDQCRSFDWEKVAAQVYGKTAEDVERALDVRRRKTPDDLMALVSPAAEPYLERMALLSRRLTLKRFGRTVQMYIPLYLSNECSNACTYCGFRAENKIKRLTLSEEEILREVEVIKALGFDHLLLVTGEADRSAGIEYFVRVLRLIRPYFSHISMEVQPLEEEDYRRLIAEGLDTVYFYQETYDQKSYREHHPRGRKADYQARLGVPERLGRAGIHKIGLGALLGLSDWRVDACFLGLHLSYLEKHYWQCRYCISFPRLRPAQGIVPPKIPVGERELVQLICAYRIFNENVELSLSTRERSVFRDHALELGVTSLSAGSKTEPGGYALGAQALEQFVISDERSPAQVAASVKKSGREPLWKDWDPSYNTQAI